MTSCSGPFARRPDGRPLDPRGGLPGRIVQLAVPAPAPPRPRADTLGSSLRSVGASLATAVRDDPATARSRIAAAARQAADSTTRRLLSDTGFTLLRERRLAMELLPDATPATLWAAASHWAAGLRDLVPEEALDPAHTLLGRALRGEFTETQALGVASSLPDWLAGRLLAEHDPDDAIALATSLRGRAPLSLRANPLRGGSRESLLAELATHGAVAGRAPQAVTLTGHPDVNGLPCVRQGRASVQDDGSQRVAALVAARPGEVVVDACAGAGGKALALAADMEGRGRLILCDTRKDALQEARARLREAGAADVAESVPCPDDGLPAALHGRRDRCDAVLVDAPCSGSGALRREPWNRWLRADPVQEALPRKQQALLSRFAALVRPGGRLVYATCSLLRCENDDVVAGFLAARSDFAPAGEPLRLLPHRDGTDGFFAMALRRADR